MNSFFSLPHAILIEIITTGALGVVMRDNGRTVINSGGGGTYTVTGQGNHTLRFDVRTNSRSTLRVKADGVTIGTHNNFSSREVIVGHQPCQSYEIPNARTGCRSGFRLVSVTEYRTAQTVRSRGIRGPVSTRTAYGSWQSTRPNPPRDYRTQGSANNFREGTNGRVEERSTYSCEPEEGCQGNPIYETRDTNTGNYSLSLSVNVAESPQAMQDRLAREQAQRDAETERQRQERERQQAEANRIERERLDLEQREQAEAQRLNDLEAQRETSQDFQRVEDIPEDNQDSKYRIVSPRTVSIINGKEVPDIRYESVRFLSAESASSYILRGYEVSVVPDNVPLSFSKPYGASIVERSKIIGGDIPVGFTKRENNNRRKTWSDFTNIQTQTFPTGGGVQKRINTRRVVI